jgi:hypothetical protein
MLLAVRVFVLILVALRVLTPIVFPFKILYPDILTLLSAGKRDQLDAPELPFGLK